MRWIKALFGIYEYKPYSQKEFFKKFEHLIKTVFEIYPISDLHCGGEYQDNPMALQIVRDLKKLPPEKLRWVYSLGDIFDFVAAHLKNLEWMYDDFAELILLLKERYRLGNHEAMGENDKDLLHLYFPTREPLYQMLKDSMNKKPMGEYIDTLPNGVRVMLDHGDLFTKKQQDDYLPYRYKKHGAKGFDLVKVEFLDKLDWPKSIRPLPKGYIDAVVDKMIEQNADVAVFGHFHMKEITYFYHRGKVVIILPAHHFNTVAIPEMMKAA